MPYMPAGVDGSNLYYGQLRKTADKWLDLERFSAKLRMRCDGSGQLLGFDLFEDVALEVSRTAKEPHFRLSHLNSMR